MGSYQSKPLRWTLVALRVILGAVFIYGGYVKLRDPWPLFAMGIDSYHLVPFRFVEPLARTLPAADFFHPGLIVAGGLLFGHGAREAGRPADQLRLLRAG